MTTDTDRSYYVISPADRAIYELPTTTTVAEAEAWLQVRQESDVLSWSARLVYATESEARAYMASHLPAADPLYTRWNA